MRITSSTYSKRQGFTLIELPIVLVIIGLIVGGVLVGQDLIRAAEIRATVGQIEKYNAALNTFRAKYNGMPGDLTSTAATNFAFQARGGTAGLGDGNGLIEGSGGSSSLKQCGEPLLFWRDLSDANLLGATISATVACTNFGSSNINTAVPPAKLGRGNAFATFSTGGLNYYGLGGISATTSGDGTTTATNALTPLEASNIDSKMDDGAPNTGVVVARDFASGLNTAPLASASAATGKCNIGTGSATTDTYNSGTYGTELNCALRARFN